MLEKWRHAGAILMDLSKAFDTINHELFLAKLHTYGFSMHSLLILSNYLSNRKQSVKINNRIKNIDVCNFADDRTPYVCDESIEKVLRLLEENTELALCWFENNCMKLNTGKCHLIVSVYKHEQVLVQGGGDKIWESVDVKLLGVAINENRNLINMFPRFALKQAEN